jgi:hypothetical protein
VARGTALPVHHPAVDGQVDAQLTVLGSVEAPVISGDIRLSRGSLLISSASVSSFAPSPARPSTAAPPPNAAVTSTPSLFTPFQAPPISASLPSALAPVPPPAPHLPLTLKPLSLHLGPDLRVSSFPFLQLNVAGSLELSGAVSPDGLQAVGDVELGPGIVNVFATQFNMDRNHISRVSFTGDTTNPHIDAAMASKEFHLMCDAKLQDAGKAITITRLSDGSKQTVGSAGGAVVFEQQLRALLLEHDGQLAVQSMVMNALSSMLPRIEGFGRFGNAQWRLVGELLPSADICNSSAMLSAQVAMLHETLASFCSDQFVDVAS